MKKFRFVLTSFDLLTRSFSSSSREKYLRAFIGGKEVVNVETGKTTSFYVCGPTVYDSAHIGHARTYISLDIIRRILSHHFNVNLHFAMGITDVDDKIIDKVRKSPSLHEMEKLTKSLENDFFSDMDILNVRRPDTVLRVTEHIPEIISFIEELVKHNNAYIVSSGVYFDVSKLGSQYGRHFCGELGSDSESQLLENTNEKRDVRDFALWKFPKSADEPSWSSPWGSGRPGWHIECSAMIQSLFGSRLDIHAGGVDLRFPHHTNEIAQR